MMFKTVAIKISSRWIKNGRMTCCNKKNLYMFTLLETKKSL